MVEQESASLHLVTVFVSMRVYVCNSSDLNFCCTTQWATSLKLLIFWEFGHYIIIIVNFMENDMLGLFILVSVLVVRTLREFSSEEPSYKAHTKVLRELRYK